MVAGSHAALELGSRASEEFPFHRSSVRSLTDPLEMRLLGIGQDADD
jgi:hypothetical protein